MYRLRLSLRASHLTSDQAWVSSISICVRAAQTLLNSYFNLLTPQLTRMQRPELLCLNAGHRLNDAVISGMPSTWRQVQRIVTSSLVVFYAYWHGECSQSEIAQSTAITLLLLKLYSTRWQQYLDSPRILVQDLTRICDVQIEGAVKSLIPNLSAEDYSKMLRSLFERFPKKDYNDGQNDAQVDRSVLSGGTTWTAPRLLRQNLWNPAVDEPYLLADVFDSSTELDLFGIMPDLPWL